MRARAFLASAWDWDLSVILGCAFAAIAYVLWSRLREPKRAVLFGLGLVILLLALVSPLDVLADEYLFSAHMLQHLILLLVVPPLLIGGMPEAAMRKLLGEPWIERTEHALTRPWRAWVSANGVLWLWHYPRLYDLAVAHETIHIIQHLMFLISSTIFWWPLLSPVRESRMPFTWQPAYLFLASVSNMALGILLTFSTTAVYSAYRAPVDAWGILPILRTRFGLDPLTDQRLGGLLMWVIGGFVFLAITLIQFAGWFEQPDEERVLKKEQT